MNKRKTHNTSRPTRNSYVKLGESLKSTHLIVRLNAASEEKSSVTRQTIIANFNMTSYFV